MLSVRTRYSPLAYRYRTGLQDCNYSSWLSVQCLLYDTYHVFSSTRINLDSNSCKILCNTEHHT